MVNRGADELRKEQVRAVFEGDADGFDNAPPRVEHEEAVRRGPHYAIQCRWSLLMPPRESPRSSRI